jgi:hypothetical protein
LVNDQGEQRSPKAIGGSLMPMKFVRFTAGPSHRVTLGLCEAQTQEYVTLENEQLETLSQEAQKHLARLAVTDKQPITVQWYEPRVDRQTGNTMVVVPYYGQPLPERFATPPFTVELVIDWITNIAERCSAAEVEAAEWYDAQVRYEQTHLWCTDDNACHFGLKALSEGKSFTTGPYGVTWALSTASTVRMNAIELARRQEAERITNEARQAAKRARREFVARVVETLGSESQKERFALELLPMAEVGDELQRHVLGTWYDRLCKDEDLEVAIDPVRLPAGAFMVYKGFKAAVDAADLALIGEITIRPVYGYTNIREARRMLCEVRIADDPDHSDWACERLYYLD